MPNNLDEIIKKHINSYRSIGEREMFDYIHNLANDAINNDRHLISPKEIDIFVPSKNVGFEFDGLFWHNEENLLNKTLLCLEKGVKLLHFYEDEWQFKQDICKSIISSALGIYQNKIYARKCEIREISNNEYCEFLNENHIQGSVNSKIKIGLFYNGELVQCIGVGKTRYSNNQFELYRMCSKKFYQIIGGFSKLLSYLKQTYEITELYSYVDRRLYDGNGYFKTGFEIVSITKPSYFYFKRFNRENRLKYQKHKLKNILPNFNNNLSEVENMLNNGYKRIFDCGTYKVKVRLL